jgi:hypothetical protein
MVIGGAMLLHIWWVNAMRYARFKIMSCSISGVFILCILVATNVMDSCSTVKV